MKRIIKNISLIFIMLLIVCSLALQIGNVYAFADSNTMVYLGGAPIGIIAESDGLLVTEIINVTTKEGSFSPALKAGIKKGDIIFAINGEKISDISSFNKRIQSSNDSILISLIREDNKIAVTVYPEFDVILNSRKIGLSLKNNIAGIGTLTYIKQNGEYGALGHQIIDCFGNGEIYSKGKIFKCDITGYIRAKENIPGELLGKINMDYPSIGNIKKNRFCGIYGTFNDKSQYNKKSTIEIGKRSDVKNGKAFIITTIGQNMPQKYEIEIVKALKQNQPEEKGMIIRVTDKKLLTTTKGILQGMSGSPIIQNGKLIGAVTHVFTNDTTMGYGIYIDWMINNA